MNPTKEQIIQELRRLKPFLLKKGVTSLALFGSFAKDEASVYSDIDIAIRMSPELIKKKGSYGYFDLLNEIKVQLRRKLHRNIDIFDLESDSPFKAVIEKEMISV